MTKKIHISQNIITGNVKTWINYTESKQFKERYWSEKYISLNTKYRTIALNETGKDKYKILNSSIFGKLST